MPEMTEITLTIDGRTVNATTGDTVLDAARRAGIYIPTLCAHEDLSPFGACRLCIVEIDGVRGYPTSCTTPAAAGMVVRTQSQELEELRNDTMEMMLTGHPNSCLVCDHRVECERARPHSVKAGNTTKCLTCSNRSGCVVREMVLPSTTPNLRREGLKVGDGLHLPRIYSHHKVERDDPFIERNHNLCVLCGRCWRVCEQIHGTPAISIINRGGEARIGTAFGRSWVESGCTFCGACVDICPTGTLTDRFARWYPAPRREAPATCLLCPEACSMQLIVNGNQAVATRMNHFKRPDRLCALGRFAYPQVLSSSARLRRPMVREKAGLTPVPWEEAISTVATALADYRDGSFALIAGEPQTNETRATYERFAREVMHGQFVSVPSSAGTEDSSQGSVVPHLRPEGPKVGESTVVGFKSWGDLAAGRIRALWTTGDYIPEELLEKVPYVVVADFLPSAAARRANAVFPVAVLAETEGTVLGANGEQKSLAALLPAPGQAKPEVQIVCDLAQAMGVPISEASPHVCHSDPDPERSEGEGEESAVVATSDTASKEVRDRLSDLPTRFRGHLLADIVPPLKALGLPAAPVASTEQLTGFLVVEHEEIVPNFHRFIIEAPAVARHAKPGQFAIVMVNEKSERVPFTLVDWDKQTGTITLIVEEVGRSTQEIMQIEAGQRVAHVSGPLGLPLPISKVGTVALGGGCYGIGAILPIARAFKQAGNQVFVVIEGCTENMLYMEKELRAVCDRLYLATKDGSRGRKGGVQDVFPQLLRDGVKIDQFVAIGCTFMMWQVAEKTSGLGVPLQVALNPIMVDGTGMCGACRVTVGSGTKFACVDGPLFDGHAVDWAELFSRRGAYIHSEVEAMPQAIDGIRRRLQQPHGRLNVVETPGTTGD